MDDKNSETMPWAWRQQLPAVGAGYAEAGDIANLPERSAAVYVPGRQITLAHIIAAPKPVIYEKLSLAPETGRLGEWAIGIMKFTPWETSFVAADLAADAAAIQIGFVDRFVGCLVITGCLANVEIALEAVIAYCRDILHYAAPALTRS